MSKIREGAISILLTHHSNTTKRLLIEMDETFTEVNRSIVDLQELFNLIMSKSGLLILPSIHLDVISSTSVN